ncbi:response regulator transcription factor [Paenibacillus lemnae]|uniref:Response regulator n=1 Tax=Paenibacillus lemnae TaxID=1330551 RepID=A0A848M9X9_PAELE|nr:response regulator [Paenibacillus lemnae]NMO97857.1 response regulator [Paenibacillus lemnae]
MNKVLVVDDERIVRIGFKTIIDWNRHGYHLVGTAKNGIHALEMVQELDPDIVVTDLKMPQMDGLELIRQLDLRRYKGKVIALSNHAEFDLIREAMVLGASDYILKVTLNPEDLITVLNKVMDRIWDEKKQTEQNIRQEISLHERRAIMKTNYFKELLLNPEITKQAAFREAEDLKIEAAHSPSFVIYMVIDPDVSASSTAAESELKLQSLNIKNIAIELLGERKHTEVIELSHIQWLIVIPVIVGQNDSERLKLASLLTNNVRLFTGLKSCAVTSRVIPDFSSLREAYQTCLRTAELSFYQGYEFVLEGNDRIFIASDFTVEKNMFESYLQSPDAGLLTAHITEICREAAERHIQVQDVKQFACWTISTLQSGLFPDVTDHADADAMIVNLNEADHVHKLKFSWVQAVQQLLQWSREHYQGSSRKEVRDVIQYMAAHLQDKITLEDISRVAALNESYVCRLFKQETGKNIFEYLNELRIEEAKKLITSTELTIKEISLQVGISNPFYFSRLFKKWVGQSPNQYKGSCHT